MKKNIQIRFMGELVGQRLVDIHPVSKQEDPATFHAWDTRYKEYSGSRCLIFNKKGEVREKKLRIEKT